MSTSYCFLKVQWHKYAPDITQIRETVFHDLLFDHPYLTADQIDPDCDHVVCYNGEDQIIASGRLTGAGEISHIVVDTGWRGKTVGTAILVYLLHIAERRHYPQAWTMTHRSLQGFYEKKGLVVDPESVPGPLIKMVKTLKQSQLH